VSSSGVAAQPAAAVQVKEAPAAAAPTPRPLPPPAATVATVAKPPPAPAPDPQDAVKAVDAWAEAWSRQDVGAYFAAYAPDFHPPGQSRQAWEDQRRERVSAPKSISVAVEGAKASLERDGKVRVTFLQHYRSDQFKSSSTKTLVMNRSADGRWRIVEERVGR
jgi:ketosteroid isomerase-like protein